MDKELSLLNMELKGNDVLTSVANPGNICDAIEQNIFPIFIMIEEKLEKLKESFFSINRRIDFEIDGESGSRMVGTIDSNWGQLKENWLTKQVRMENKKLSHIKYSYELKGFKKTVAAPSFWIVIDIHFYEYNYILLTDINKNQPLQIPYGKMIDISDLQSFITPLIKDIIDRIKQLNGKN